jgi:hypothetical protein
MIAAERNGLTPVRVLISNSLVHLELFENGKGNLFLSSGCINPQGVVYYATTPASFCAFLQDSITLQSLFNDSPSIFVEISNEQKTALYSRNDVEPELKCGDKTIKQLADGSPIEIWECQRK